MKINIHKKIYICISIILSILFVLNMLFTKDTDLKILFHLTIIIYTTYACLFPLTIATLFKKKKIATYQLVLFRLIHLLLLISSLTNLRFLF